MIPFKLLRVTLGTLRQYRGLPPAQRVALREDADRVRELTLRLGGGRVRQMLAGDGLVGPASSPAERGTSSAAVNGTSDADPAASAAGASDGDRREEPSEAQLIAELRVAVAGLARSIAGTGIVGGAPGAAIGRRLLGGGEDPPREQ